MVEYNLFLSEEDTDKIFDLIEREQFDGTANEYAKQLLHEAIQKRYRERQNNEQA